ncbi:MAG: OmpP1/FadL family transporter, partial [Betaproteobacteria bacterium]
MRRTLAVFAAAALSISIFSSTSFAAGFSLPDQDAAAMGMANAFTGQADNPAAVWYNPAGITQLDGTQVSGGIIGIYPVFTHENNDGTTDVAKRDIALPFVLFGTNKVNDRLSLGLGITSPFGLSARWSDASKTRYVATYSNLETVNVNPNIAYRVNDDLSLALGIDYVHARATLEKTVNLGGPSPDFDRNFRLSGDGDGWGANIA